MLDFNTIAGVSIPFVGTTLGAAMVFFMKDKIHPLLQKALLGFSSGVMMAASVWSLLIPAWICLPKEAWESSASSQQYPVF